MQKVNFKVLGIKNFQNKKSIELALSNLDGVREVFVDIKKGSIEVAYNEETREEKIRECIRKSGYEIQSEIEW